MANFTWDNDKINKIENTKLKDTLLKENEGAYSLFDETMKPTLSLSSFKEKYSSANEYMNSISSYLYEITLSLPKIINLGALPIYHFNHQGFNADIVIEILKDFVIYLDDPDLTKYFNYLIDPNNHVLRIHNYDKSIPIAQEVRGRVISLDEETYLSFYLKDSMDDITFLAHEIGHYFSKKYETNPYIKYFASEFEAIVLELIVACYIGKTIEDEELINCLKSNRIASTISDILITEYQHLLYIQRSKTLDINKLSKKVNRKLKQKIKIQPPMEALLKDDILGLRGRIHSSLLSYCILERNNWDIKSSFENYKDILRSESKTFDSLIQEYNITLQEYLEAFYTNYEEAKIFERSRK